MPKTNSSSNNDTLKVYTFTFDKKKSFCEKHPNGLIAFRGQELTPQHSML